LIQKLSFSQPHFGVFERDLMIDKNKEIGIVFC